MTDRTEYAECPDSECLSGGPHPVTSGGAELECRLCHVPFVNPFAELGEHSSNPREDG